MRTKPTQKASTVPPRPRARAKQVSAQSGTTVQPHGELFAKVFKVSPHPIGVTELSSGRCLEVNEACLKIFGFQRDEVIGKTTLALGLWPDPGERAKLIERLKSEGAVTNLEVAMRMKNGARRYFLISTDLITFKRKRCLLTIGNDITERKAAQEELRCAHQDLEHQVRERTAQLVKANAVLEHEISERRHAEEMFEANEALAKDVLDSLSAHVCVLNKQGVILRTNKAWKAFANANSEAGVRVGEVGDNYLDVCRRASAVGDTTAQVILTGIESILAGRQTHFSEEYPCHAPQEVRWFLLRVTALHDGSGAVLAHLNITERKAAEEHLRKSEARYRTLVEATSAVVWSCPPSGLQDIPQPSWMAFTGQSAEEMLGSGWTHMVHPDDAAAAGQRWSKSVARGEPFAHMHRIRRHDGQWRWMSVFALPLRDLHGRVVEWFGMHIDVTMQKQVEETLQRNQRDLWEYKEQLQDLTSKLLVAQEAERQRIARDLHDDFTQRLAALAVDVGALETACASESSAVGRLRSIREAAGRLADDMHTFAYRLHPSTLEHLGLEAAIHDYLDDFRQRTGLAVQYLSRDVPRAIPLEKGTCLYRVIQEALQNVSKHARASQVTVRLLGTAEGVGICVHDNGHGFSQSLGERQNHGLGLISMEERVRLYQGTFLVRTRPGNGTELHAWVPLDHAHQGDGR